MRASSGVTVGQPVVSAGGLIGSITTVSTHLATVTLLDDPSFTVGVRVVSSGIVGAAAGEGQGNLLQVENVEVGAHVKRGDALVTSGLQGERFPPGIPVGTVASVFAPPGRASALPGGQALRRPVQPAVRTSPALVAANGLSTCAVCPRAPSGAADSWAAPGGGVNEPDGR